jgi:phytoene dehydrogenase-like protein
LSAALDVVVIGAGPNGLAAALRLQEGGARVLVLEGSGEPGGGTRTSALTLPGFRHDVCAAVHPMGICSPYLRTLPLQQHGLRWLQGEASVAHPLDDGPAALLLRSPEETAALLGADGPAYLSLVRPFLRAPHALFEDALAPLRLPRHPLLLARFGLRALRSARGLVSRFSGDRARALLAGCAGHAILPLDAAFTGGLALTFLLTGHAATWPVAEGGSQAITGAMVSLFEQRGGELRCGVQVRSLRELPEARVYLFDTSPRQLEEIAGEALPNRYRKRLRAYRYGPGVFKLDWALSGPIPWKDPRAGSASTVHLGGTFEEIAAAELEVARGGHPERPYVLLAQQSALDPSRAPPGQHTGWAYCHVPAGSALDQTEAIERQVERFAPGFRQLILARHQLTPAAFEAYNPNYVGGAVTGGAADWRQLFTRPVARLDPYTTPNPRLFLCSASTPPGGGVHGMCGFYAAGSALRRLGLRAPPLAAVAAEQV